MKHTPGPWKWDEDGWAAADASGSVHANDGENESIEKYMGLSLRGAGSTVIPIRIDHYEVIYDGDPITPADRALIAAAPDLLAACKEALLGCTDEFVAPILQAAIERATGEKP